ncbi:MAG: hypothetical protein ACE5J2_01355 [Nitrososphaerales archaeon]
MKLIALILFSFLLLGISANIAYAQEGTRKIETLTIPHTAANADRFNPAHYNFASKHQTSWILTIRNNLVYSSDNPDAKVVLRLKEEPESEKYVEFAMFGAPSKILWIAIANQDVGYLRTYQNENGWFEDKDITVTLTQSERLSVTNGQRNVMDRLRIGEFIFGTIEVYGKDSSDAATNTIGGNIEFDIISGNPLDNPIFIMPAVLAVAAIGVVATLLLIKKRT